MATINAYKMDGLGNDFIIIDRREKSIEIKKNKLDIELNIITSRRTSDSVKKILIKKLSLIHI